MRMNKFDNRPLFAKRNVLLSNPIFLYSDCMFDTGELCWLRNNCYFCVQNFFDQIENQYFDKFLPKN